MNEQMFAQVADVLQDQLPADWEKVVFFAAYLTDSYEMKFFVKTPGKPYIDCFSLPGGDDMELLDAFVRIDTILAPYREKEGRWNIMTLSLTRDGDFQAQFDYQEVDDDFIDLLHEREAKYIAGEAE